MEKKKCPQCKNLILKTSPTCLYCGRPNKFITKEYVKKKWNKDKNKNVFDYIFINKYLVLILFLIFIIAFTWVSIKGDLRKLASELIEDNENNKDN